MPPRCPTKLDPGTKRRIRTSSIQVAHRDGTTTPMNGSPDTQASNQSEMSLAIKLRWRLPAYCTCAAL